MRRSSMSSSSLPTSSRAASALAVVLLAGGALSGCATDSPEAASATEETHHFDYDVDSEHGPERWGDTPGWERCSRGKLQSPVDVPVRDAKPLGKKVKFSYAPGTLSALNNGHTVNVRPEGENTVTFDGRSFALAQIHLHADSEHDLDGEAAPLEAHFVHGLVNFRGELVTTKDSDTGEEILSEYLVLGVMLEEGRVNPAWGRILDADVLPAEVGNDYARVAEEPFDPTVLLPDNRDAYSYTGSLTTPTPTCVEGVNWFVLTTPVEVSSEQIKAFTDLYANNARPIQPRG